MSLATLQRRFFAHLRNPSGGSLEFVQGTAEASREQRLDVYRHAYRARAVEALASDFPALAAWLGSEAFAALVHDYLDAHPSRSFSLRDFGAALPGFLRGTLRRHADAVACDLATFEWALCEAFDAADGVALGANALAAMPAAAWPASCFSFHASVQRLGLQTNAPELWAAHDAGRPLPAVGLSKVPAPWLVWRQDLKLMYRALDGLEAAALDAACDGASFGEICMVLAESAPLDEVPAIAAGYLRRWLAAGLVIGVDGRGAAAPA